MIGPVASIPEADLARLPEILRSAHIPSLLMALHQITGDRRWLREPHLPTRARGQEAHDTGGLPEDVQATIRQAAAVAIEGLARGGEPAIPAPGAEQLQEMMSVCFGEAVPPEYARMAEVEMGFTPALAPDLVEEVRGSSAVPSAIVIGAGVSGIAAAKYLRDIGAEVTILERNSGPGGTWHTNQYPGCGVDVPSHLYSFSFTDHDWHGWFAKQPDVGRYIEAVVDDLALGDAIVHGCEVRSAEWDDHRSEWVVTAELEDGSAQTFRATLLIPAAGLFNPPHVPNLPGADDFRGPAFHSSQWPEGLDVSGRRVAVLGSGASAMQIVPAISRDPSTPVVVFQRNPQWIAPVEGYFDAIPDDASWLFRHVPFYRQWYRIRLAWVWADKVHAGLAVDPEWEGHPAAVNKANDRVRQHLTDYVTAKLHDAPDLLKASIPDYPPYARRLLIDNGWFDALRRSNVQLVTEGVTSLTADGVVSVSGAEHPADVVVYATGFRTSEYLHPIRIVGRGGRVLAEEWQGSSPRALLGMAVPGFPNLFMMYGPNTNPPGGSYIWIAECQARWISHMAALFAGEGLSSVEPSQEAFENYVTKVDEELSGLLWSRPEVDSYYKDDRGHVVTNSPWRVVDYWAMTRRPDLGDFELMPTPVQAGR